MSRIFLSHSSKNNERAVALRDWLAAQGWDDVFLDLDPQRGIAAGDRWGSSLNQAALRCEAGLFLVPRAGVASVGALRSSISRIGSISGFLGFFSGAFP